ncbi:MAG: RedB protein [Labilithrix sp.]|nr:RedB protein [Labilithrix sp.]MCW5812205.1 RedB protein [Labilithrix sp.]
MLAKRRIERRVVVALVVWAAAASGGLYAVAAHGARAGAAAEAPETLRAELHTSGRATIVVAAHPSCPCTRATLRELDRIARDTHGAADVVVLFAGSERDRVGVELRRAAEAIPGARVVDDPARAIAKSLGAHTSGTVLFYDADGALRFSGGITPSRGHEGDSAGADEIRALVAGATRGHATTPVFGCPLARTTP